MVLLCFLLDLRSLSLPILRDLRKSLLQLANYYAVPCSKNSDETQSSSKPLLDSIGICYVWRNLISGSDELKIAYNPHGNFNLRDLHHALNNLPTDAFLPDSNGFDLKLADVLSEKLLYTWEGHDKNVPGKVISISSCLAGGTLDSVTMKALMDVADKNVSVEFVFLERTSKHLGDTTESVNLLIEQISSLKNCSFQTCVPDPQVLYGLVKRWLRELKNERDELLQASLVFKTTLVNTTNLISCNLYTSFNPMVDEFHFCQTCRCHGIPLNQSNMKPMRTSSCPITNEDLGDLDIIENSVRISEQTILYMPSFQSTSKSNKVSSFIDLNVIQRTNLGSLSEGLIMGATYFVTPSTLHDSDGNKKSVLNSQLFQGVCSVLNSFDQGLVCSSTCNIETGKEVSFQCYYILLPSDKGLMLLRRLSALEEFLPIPYISQLVSSEVVEEIKNTVQASLLKVEVSDYNPVQHERGFHKKLNSLVKESLQFGAILPKSKGNSELDWGLSPEDQPSVVAENELPQKCDITKQTEENESSSSLSEEWERLIVNELGVVMPSPACNPNPKLDQPAVTSPPSQNINRQLDEKTSRILERLEIPRQHKRKMVSPTISSCPSDVCAPPAKKPLIPYKSTDVGLHSSQPLKPSFQRIKRKA
ncbi:hypothetical protein CASFOL_000904 [Castilleja foliolosa]|uniref:Uncharacterized protein n=1 Tax=Castilleja foliolosa TaxID=1961234 RepID=A0ABD3EL07_9LAMI